MTPSLEGWPANPREALSPHEAGLASLDNNSVFQSLGEKPLVWRTLSLNKPLVWRTLSCWNKFLNKKLYWHQYLFKKLNSLEWLGNGLEYLRIVAYLNKIIIKNFIDINKKSMLSAYFRIRQRYSCSDSTLLKLVDAEGIMLITSFPFSGYTPWSFK